MIEELYPELVRLNSGLLIVLLGLYAGNDCFRRQLPAAGQWWLSFVSANVGVLALALYSKVPSSAAFQALQVLLVFCGILGSFALVGSATVLNGVDGGTRSLVRETNSALGVNFYFLNLVSVLGLLGVFCFQILGLAAFFTDPAMTGWTSWLLVATRFGVIGLGTLLLWLLFLFVWAAMSGDAP